MQGEQGRHPLDPAIEAVLDAIDPGAPTMDQLPLDELRRQVDAMREWHGPVTEVAHVDEIEIQGRDGRIRVRVYTSTAEGPKPLIVYTYGGGFITGSIDFADGPARLLAESAGAVLVSVDYRRAPEYRFPAGLEDAYTALTWAAAEADRLGADRSFLALAGDSSGGNFAAALALMARDRNGPVVAHQLLMYPVLDHDFSSPSYLQYAEGYFLTRNAMRHFWDSYLSAGGDGHAAYVSPLRAPDLRGLPEATIVVCHTDPLRSEAEAYTERLAAAGVTVSLIRFHDLVHGCFHMAGISARARSFVTTSGGAIREAYERRVRGHH